MTLIIIGVIGILAILIYLFLNKKKPEPPPPAPPSPPPPIEKVKIKVCETTNLLPNPYCPKVIEKEFEKGKEPTTLCGIHKKPDPPSPPPPKPARPKTLVGTSVYELMEFMKAVIYWFLKSIYDAGGNCTEIFASYTWSKGASIQPYLKVGDLFDYTKPNPIYWDKLRYIMEVCAEFEITLIIRLFDFCSVLKDEYYELLVWHHSIQKEAWQGSGKAWGGFYGTTATDGKGPRPYYAAFIGEIQALEKETGCKVIYHAINEPGYVPNKGEIENWIGRDLPKEKKEWNLTSVEEDLIRMRKDKIILDFHTWLYSVVKYQIMNPAVFTRTANYGRSLKVWIEIHGCNSPEKFQAAIDKGGVPNGDGPDPLARGRQGNSPDKREPSVEQAEQIGAIVKKNNVPYALVFNRKVEETMPPVLERAQFDVLKAMVKGVL